METEEFPDCPNGCNADVAYGKEQEHPDEPPVARAKCTKCGADLI